MSLHTIKNAYQVGRHYGLSFGIFRAQYELRRKTGLLKRKFPADSWSQIALGDWLKQQTDVEPSAFLQAWQSNDRQFFFKSGDLPGINKNYRRQVKQQADEILQNRFRYFFDRSYDLGSDPDWFVNPVTGRRIRSNRHWCDINLFEPDVGDIKFIWEPSRFAWTYTLVRAYAAIGENKYAEKFWTLLESWLNANQPNMGPNYACGQECAIRLMAMCWALHGLGNAQASTTTRKIKLITAIAVHAERIEKNIDFAISTRTNHSLTEAAGIYTAGLLLPEFKQSERWLKLGKKILNSEGLKQIYTDGSYIQHSMNYHRLMLQVLLWVVRLAQLNGDSFSDNLVSRVAKATEFLYLMQDDESPRVPNYGANDGALIIPLNSCDYLDYRPVIQALNYLSNGKKVYEPGPWDEDLLWFFGPEAPEAPLEPLERKSRAYDCGGYYTLRNDCSWAMMRCHSHKDRPGHADMLHLDLWWKGVNILRDSGSFMYNCDEPWQSFFGSTAAHNTLVVDGTDQMRRVSRFMWSNWTKSKFILHKNYALSDIKTMQGEHYGYRQKNIVHKRSVLSLAGDCWLIVDDILGTGTHKVEVYWQLCDYSYELKGNQMSLRLEQGVVCLAVLDYTGDSKCRLCKGDESEPAGWQSLYYGGHEPAPVLICSAEVNLPSRFITLVAAGDTISSIAMSKRNTVSWALGTSGQENVVALSPIGDSQKDTFVFVQRGADQLLLG